MSSGIVAYIFNFRFTFIITLAFLTTLLRKYALMQCTIKINAALMRKLPQVMTSSFGQRANSHKVKGQATVDV